MHSSELLLGSIHQTAEILLEKSLLRDTENEASLNCVLAVTGSAFKSSFALGTEIGPDDESVFS